MPEPWVQSAAFVESVMATVFYLVMLAPKAAAVWRRFWQWGSELAHMQKVLILYALMVVLFALAVLTKP